MDLTIYNEELGQFDVRESECDIIESLDTIINYYNNFEPNKLCLLYTEIKKEATIQVLIKPLSSLFFRVLTANTENNLEFQEKYTNIWRNFDLMRLTRMLQEEVDYTQQRIITKRGFKCNSYIYMKPNSQNIYIPSSCNIPTRLLILYFYMRGGYFELILQYEDQSITINKWSNTVKFSNGMIMDIQPYNYVYSLMSMNIPGDTCLTVDYLHNLCDKQWSISSMLIYTCDCKFVNLAYITKIELAYTGGIKIDNLYPIKLEGIPYTIRPIISSVTNILLTIMLIHNDILEDSSVFVDGELNWNTITLRGINHFYSMVDILFDSPLISDDQRQLIADKLAAENNKQSVIFKLHCIELGQ